MRGKQRVREKGDVNMEGERLINATLLALKMEVGNESRNADSLQKLATARKPVLP